VFLVSLSLGWPLDDDTKSDPLVGQTLAGGRYRVDRRIGAGGMGAVYEGTQLELGRRVAIKVLLDADSRAVERFRQEALALGQVTSPHVVSVLDFVLQHDPVFLVMEILEGEPLSRLLARKQSLPIPLALEITRQILAGLETAHRRNIVHRDIKPSNIWLTQRRSATTGESDLLVKLLDFGIAKLVSEERAYKTTTGVLIGTPAYVAPEQFLGASADTRSDLYSTALCFYEMVAGSRPWGQKRGPDLTLAILNEPAPPLTSRVPGFPPRLSAFIDRCLSKKSADRPTDASAMASELALLESEELPEPKAPDTIRDAPLKPKPKPKPKPMSRTFAIACGATLLLATPLIALQLRSRPAPTTTQNQDATPITTTTMTANDEDEGGSVASATSAAPSSSSSSSSHLANPAPTALASGMRPYCKCQGRVKYQPENLCTQKMPPLCHCLSQVPNVPQARLCRVRWRRSATHDEWLCDDNRYRGPDVKRGGDCLGYFEPTSASMDGGAVFFRFTDGRPVNGTLQLCTTCYDPPFQPAIPNTPCTGYLHGDLENGTWTCW